MALPAHIIADKINHFPLNMGVDGAEWLASPGNIAISFDNGDVALFEVEGPDEYQVHFLFVARGREAINHARESFRQMIETHRAKLIFGMVPGSRRDAKIFARWTGGKSAGMRATENGPCELFVMSDTMWKGVES